MRNEKGIQQTICKFYPDKEKSKLKYGAIVKQQGEKIRENLLAGKLH